jgi:ABC-type transporter Mla subunit MlaD
MPNWAIGLVAVVVIAVGSVLAYTKELPWSDPHEVHAIFPSAQTIRSESPVRVAGVNVGKVTGAELTDAPIEDANGDQRYAVRVTMEIEEKALPLKEDALFKVRPRLFIDGNYFVDVHPGSPSAAEVPEGHTFGLDQTSHSVQLDQVLTTLQSDVRTSLQTFLDQFGNALVRYRGAEGLRELFRSSGPAYRFSAEVSESQLGTHERDLRGVISGLGKVFRGLGREPVALSNLITNLRRVSGAFAAEDVALGRAIERLPDLLEEGPPTFQALNKALPSLRAFSREALPGVEKSPEALRAGLPLLQQLRGLMSRDELRGLVSDLRPTVPQLTRLAQANRRLFTQTRAFSSCFNEVIIPWSHSSIEPPPQYPHGVSGRNFETSAYSITGSAGESRSGDAAGQHLRVLGGTGSNLVRFPSINGRSSVNGLFGLTPFPILGAIPRIDDSVKTDFRPEARCERQQPPNLEAGVGSPPDQQPAPTAAPISVADAPGSNRLRRLLEMTAGLGPAGSAADDVGRSARRVIEDSQRLVDELGLPEVDLEGLGQGGAP